MATDRTLAAISAFWLASNMGRFPLAGLLSRQSAELVHCGFACSSISKASHSLTKSLFFHHGYLVKCNCNRSLRSLPSARDTLCCSPAIWQMASPPAEGGDGKLGEQTQTEAQLISMIVFPFVNMTLARGSEGNTHGKDLVLHALWHSKPCQLECFCPSAALSARFVF